MFGRIRRWSLVASLLAAGCVSGPLVENPILVGARPDTASDENPILIAPGDPGPASYAEVFEKVLSAVDEGFTIATANRYDGRITTLPVTAAGVFQFWKDGSPDLRERLLATTQSYRYRAEVLIEAAPQGGYLVHVVVFKELEDLPNPQAVNSNPAAFAVSSTVERRFEIVAAEVAAPGWIPKGREPALEQLILSKIRCCQ